MKLRIGLIQMQVEMGNPNISETCPIVYIKSPKKIYKKLFQTP